MIYLAAPLPRLIFPSTGITGTGLIGLGSLASERDSTPLAGNVKPAS